MTTPQEKELLDYVLEVYHLAFPYYPEYQRKIKSFVLNQHQFDFEVILLIAANQSQRLTGFCLAFYFQDTQLAYLDYIASKPIKAERGIGSALYESLQELLTLKGARGLLLDVPPDDPKLLTEKKNLRINQKRMAFYEKHGAYPIINTLYDKETTKANMGFKTMLLYDPLQSKTKLNAATLKKAVASILTIKSGMSNEDDKLKKILASLKDPVQLRAPQYHNSKGAATRTSPAIIINFNTIDVVNVGDAHQIHHLKEKGYVEKPVRITALLKGLSGLSYREHRVKEFGLKPIKEVHSKQYIDYLYDATKRLTPNMILYPTIFPIRRPDKLPKNWEMRLGYYCIDTFTPLTKNAYFAARKAVNGALTGAQLLLEGSYNTYVMCRPPGHHAEKKVYGGFCYFNNAAIAANLLSKHGKVAFIDIDHHHGNGSQDIFYDRSDVFFISIHGHPAGAYPYFSGFSDEKGTGPGLGFNVNYPLHPGADNQRYLKVLDKAVARIKHFKPDFLVISLGLDIMKGDPTGTFSITANGMHDIGKKLGELKLPSLHIQEGGYSLHNLRYGIHEYMAGFIQGMVIFR